MNTNYRLQFHRAPLRSESNKPLHQMNDLFPDILEKPSLYVNRRDFIDVKALSVIRSVFLNPGKTVRIYRALPAFAMEINPGDWVTIVKEYAEKHAALCSESGQTFHIISMEVPADHIINDGNSVLEFGYNPR